MHSHLNNRIALHQNFGNNNRHQSANVQCKRYCCKVLGRQSLSLWGTFMKAGVPSAPKIPPELFAFFCVQTACGSADQSVTALALNITAAQQKAFLEETIFFHYFAAIASVNWILPDLESRREYCDTMTDFIHSGFHIPPNEPPTLAPLIHFSTKDQEDAIKECFFSFANLKACERQELYLARKPSESEIKIMNLNLVRQMAEWDSPSTNPVQYFSVAFLSRLCTSMKIAPRDHLLEFMQLSFKAAGLSKHTFELYINVLGGEIVTEGSEVETKNIPQMNTAALSSYAKHYASLSNEDLQRLVLDLRSLVPDARDALRMELEKRQISAETLDWTTQPLLPEAKGSSAVLLRFLRNFAIFVVFDVLYIVGAGVLLSSAGALDSERFARTLIITLLNLSVLTAFLTSKVFVPERLRTVLFIGLALPAGVIFALVLFH